MIDFLTDIFILYQQHSRTVRDKKWNNPEKSRTNVASITLSQFLVIFISEKNQKHKHVNKNNAIKKRWCRKMNREKRTQQEMGE